MMKINELRGLGSSHSMHLQWFRSNWSRLKLPPLFAEIFDIPKTATAYASMQQTALTSPTGSSGISSSSNSVDQQQPQQTIDPNEAGGYVVGSTDLGHHQQQQHHHHQQQHYLQQPPPPQTMTPDSEALPQSSETMTPISISVDNNVKQQIG